MSTPEVIQHYESLVEFGDDVLAEENRVQPSTSLSYGMLGRIGPCCDISVYGWHADL